MEQISGGSKRTGKAIEIYEVRQPTLENDGYRETMGGITDNEVRKAVNEEIQQAAKELTEEHRKTTRQIIDEYRSTVHEIVQEEKRSIRAKADEIRHSILRLDLWKLVMRWDGQ